MKLLLLFLESHILQKNTKRTKLHFGIQSQIICMAKKDGKKKEKLLKKNLTEEG